MAGLLCVVSIPSLIFLFQYSSKVRTYADIHAALKNDFQKISPLIKLAPPKISQLADSSVGVEAEALVPEGVTVSYLDQNKMVAHLEEVTKQKIALTIFLQRVLPVLDEEKLNAQNSIGGARQEFLAAVSEVDASLSLDSFDVSASSGMLLINAILRGSSNVAFTERERESIEKRLTGILHKPVILNIEIIERRSLLAEPEFKETLIRQRALRLMALADEKSEVQDVTIKRLAAGSSTTPSEYEINFHLQLLSGHLPSTGSLTFIRKQMENEFKDSFLLNLIVTKANKISF